MEPLTQNNDPIFGIDLGTSFTLAGMFQGDKVDLIPMGAGTTLLPSVIAVDGRNQVHVGEAALKAAAEGADCARAFKRNMGTDFSYSLNGSRYTSTQLSAMLLRHVKQKAEAHWGRSLRRAVISVPAYFNDRQREATVQAGRMADLSVERIINEPTAAAIAYGIRGSAEPRTVLVFDLGGGTFDVSILETFENILEIRSTAGEIFLGGEDFTFRIASNALKAHGIQVEEYESRRPLEFLRLIWQCETAKQALSAQDCVEIPAGPLPAPMKVHREEFEGWCKDLLQKLRGPLMRTLGDAGLRPEGIHEVLLVGGATRMPMVRRFAEDFFGREMGQKVDPDTTVAVGAALQAGLLSHDKALGDVVITDVAPFTIGIEMSKRIGGSFKPGYFSPIIFRNSTLPISREESYCTIEPGQTQMKLEVYQGEARLVTQNLKIGTVDVHGIPHSQGQQNVRVRLTYDANGILQVTATVVATGQVYNQVFTKHVHGLSEKQIQEAIQRIERLKVHPRDLPENLGLLSGASQRLADMPQLQRMALEEAIDRFEAALELQDLRMIQEARSQLEITLSALGAGDAPPDAPDGLPELR